MLGTLAATALLMGLAGGPHCVAMCGAACGGVARLDARRLPVGTEVTRLDAARARARVGNGRGMLLFQAGRLAGYAALGAIAAASVQGMGWLGTQVAALRPVWTLFHAAALVLGLTMLWLARQPAWLDGTGKRAWVAARALMRWPAPGGAPGAGAVLSIGALWALMPCGLLYSAVLVAALSGAMAGGAVVMAAFALGSGIMLALGPWAWRRLRGAGAQAGARGTWGVRLAGAALAAMSAWALWMGLVEQAAPWCLAP